MYPESPGFVTTDVKPLSNDGVFGLIVNAPVPLLRNAINQPVLNDDVTGNVNVPAPAFHTNVVARLASFIVGDDVTLAMFCVVAS